MNQLDLKPFGNIAELSNTANRQFYGTDGKFLGVDSQGFTGDIITMDETLFNQLTNNGANVLDHDFVNSLASNGIFANFLSKSNLGLEAPSKCACATCAIEVCW